MHTIEEVAMQKLLLMINAATQSNRQLVAATLENGIHRELIWIMASKKSVAYKIIACSTITSAFSNGGEVHAQEILDAYFLDAVKEMMKTETDPEHEEVKLVTCLRSLIELLWWGGGHKKEEYAAAIRGMGLLRETAKLRSILHPEVREFARKLLNLCNWNEEDDKNQIEGPACFSP